MWQNLISLETLATWMDGQGLGQGPIENPRTLGGGTQNVLLFFTRAHRPYVLRRPPPHPRPGSDDTIRREIRVLGALAGSNVPHPALIAGCADASVLGTAFYLMEPVDGFNPTVAMPPLHAGDPAVRHAMGLSLIDGIGALGRVDHVAVGLADFGKPEGFLQRQPARWLGQLHGYRANTNWPGPACLPDVARIAAWMDRHMPASFTPGVMHGDFHLANVMFHHTSPRLAAIVDWELATLGDPLLDLGWLLATWPAEGEDWAVGVQPWAGFPSAAELVAHYARQSPRDLAAIDWYVVLACFKLAIILEGTHARACAGTAPVETGARLHAHAVGLLHRAERLIT